MKNSNNTSGNFGRLIWLCCISILLACEADPVPEENLETLNLGVRKNHNIVEVVTTHMNLEVQKKIPAGWTTFRYDNQSHNTHFFLLDKLPGDKTVEDSKAYVVPAFQEGMNYIAEGNWEGAGAAFAKLPAWSAEIIYTGGAGLLSPNNTSEVTVYLEPGNYVLECYVKDQNNIFHATKGMISGMQVTAEDSGNVEPEATMQVNVSSTAGISFDPKVRPGKHLIKVLFEDQTTYGHFLGHDVHLVRLDVYADIEELNAWMNWVDPTAFQTPSPAGVEFLGGIQDLPALEGMPNSNVGYFDAHLKPGTYAFIAEVPDPMEKNMFKIFTVPGK